MSFLRWAIVIVPLILLLGFASGRAVPSGSENVWYQALTKPELNPPGWVFPVVWTTLYIMIGLALAMIVHARGARGRGVAIGLFVVQFALNLAWTPLFFGAHLVDIALFVIVAILAVSIATTFAFARIRRGAAWLMLPYLIWLSFAGVLNWRIGQLNPNAESLVPRAQTSQML
ncbi:MULTISPECIES: TspO/MBR family protein [unclassified Sphingomonas]|uniref:TspO/MBR family protein n=1 Tax=unclassified Sphingomonas TaxID=196159 RepID=UPI00285F4C96|nr:MULTISPECIES: TspO/MBR family protein [unclassified Sphingomonas]MDR6116289.1 benzodiazapine receptor [Sphingomonas sp. SORGH_AS_0789]MDR6150036.1 benzodiazapine receptor [Sphingomonas sp. SORGH_AS_0742]